MFCPKCGAQNEGTDKFCRTCGANLTSRPVQQPQTQQTRRRLPTAYRAILWIFGIIFGLSLLHVVLSGSDSETKQGTTDTLQSSVQGTTDSSQTYQLGQQFSVGYWTYDVHGAYWTPVLGSDLYTMNQANGEFVVVDVTVRNNDTSSSTLPPFQLADDEGRTYDESSAGSLSPGYFSVLESLNPGVSKRGEVAFDVPPGRQYVLVLSGGFESGKQAFVSLPTSTSGGKQTQLGGSNQGAAQPEAPAAPEEETGGTGTAGQPGAEGVGVQQWQVGEPSQGMVQPAPNESANPGVDTPPSESTGQTTPSSVPGTAPETQTTTLPTAPQTELPPNSPSKPAESTPQVSQPATVDIVAGTTMEVLTSEPIASDVNRTGELLRGSLAAPIMVGGQIVVPKGIGIFIRALQILAARQRGELTEIRLVLDHLDYKGQTYLLDSSSYDVANPSGKRIRISPGTAIQFKLLSPVAIPENPGVGTQ